MRRAYELAVSAGKKGFETFGALLVHNGEILEESYGREVIDADKLGIAAEPITLGEDEYFVLGDNRNHSSDSRVREVGNIKKDQIVGKAWVRIWPISDIEFITHQ